MISSKSKNVKFGKLILTAIALIGVAVFAICAGVSATVVKADGYDSLNSSEYNAEHVYTYDEVIAKKAALLDEIAPLEAQYSLNKPDNTGKEETKVLSILEVDYADMLSVGDYNDVAKKFLYGNYGFAGALKTYKYVESRLAAYSDEKLEELNLYSAFYQELKSERDAAISSFSLHDAYEHNATSPYEFTYVYLGTIISEKVDKEVRYAVDTTRSIDLEYLNPLLNELRRLDAVYFSEKYDRADVVSALFGDGEYTDAEIETMRAAVYDEVKAAGRNCVDGNATRIADAMKAVEKSYAAKYEKVKSVVRKAKNLADSFVSAEKDVDQLKGELEVIEEAVNGYYSLGSVTYNSLATKSTPAKSITVELKDDKGDLEAVSSMIDSYKVVANDAVTVVYESFKGKYGLSGQTPVAENRRLAKSLVSALALQDVEGSKALRLPDGVAYGTVRDASSIIDAYAASYVEEGTLIFGGVSSKRISDYYLVSTISSKDDGKADYVISVKCVNGDTEVNIFDSASFIGIREGATASVERNINKALRNPDKYAGNVLSADEKKDIADHGLWHYFTLTVYVPDVNGSPVVGSIDKDKTADCEFVVSIKYSDSALKGKADTDEKKEAVRIIFYEHTSVNGVISNIEWSGNTMEFRINDVSNLLVFESITKGKVPDLAVWIVLGLIGLFLLFIIVRIIVKCAKNKKYKIVFNARGGRFNSSLRVKYGANFKYPKDPVKKGCVFMGWYTEKKGVNRYVSTKLNKRKNLNLYAKWIKVEDYKKLNEKYERAAAVASTAVAAPQYVAPVVQKDPQIEKLEVEKLSYIAKKAEEERKTEEVKLQSVKEIEAAKCNEEARIKAEQEAADAKKALDEALAERSSIIERVKAEERTKCLNETAASIKADNRALAQMLADKPTEKIIVNERNYEEELRKAREEAKAEAKREFEEELRRKAEEETRINALVEARLKEINDKRRGEEELGKAGEDIDAAKLDAEMNAKIAEAERRAALAEENAKQAIENAAKIEEMARLQREEHERALQAQAVETLPVSSDVAKHYDRLKAETASYVKSDDLEFGTEKDVTVCKLSQNGESVLLELNVPYDDLEEKGYNVVRGTVLPSAYVVNSEEDIDEALELIEEAMSANGMMKSVPQIIYASSMQERIEGYDYVIRNEKVADNIDEYYALLRAYTGSFADVEGYEGEDKPLVKMFKDEGKVLVYLNYSVAGLKASEPYMAEQGYSSVVSVATLNDCKRVMAYIEQMMKENGLIRYPLLTGFVESGDDDGFAYVLKA